MSLKGLEHIVYAGGRGAEETFHIALGRLFASDNYRPSFYDFRQLFGARGRAMIGSGTASGDDRTRIATQQACEALSRRGVDLAAVQGLLIVVTVDRNSRLVKMSHVMQSAGLVAGPNIAVHMGMVFDDAVGTDMRVNLIAITRPHAPD